MSDVDDSDTETVATGIGETVSESDPLFPSLVAVTVTEPLATPFTRPLGETVATAVFDDGQPTVRPVSSRPIASLMVTVTDNVDPTTSDVELADSVTVATGAGAGASMVTVAAPV